MGLTDPTDNEIGGGIGGLSRRNVPDIIGNLLSRSADREMEITVRPEVIGGHYSVEWRYLELDRDEWRWKPVGDSPTEKNEG